MLELSRKSFLYTEIQAGNAGEIRQKKICHFEQVECQDDFDMCDGVVEL